MSFRTRASNNFNNDYSHDSNLLINKYTTSFNNTFKRDIKFIQILFPSFDPYSITFLFSLLLIFLFVVIDIIFFNFSSPLFINEDVIKKIGINRFAVSNNYQYYKLVTATFLHANIWNVLINTYYLMNIGTIIEKNYGKAEYIIIMILSVACGNLVTCATSKCLDVQMGISPILSGFIGLFLQDIIVHYDDIIDKLSIFGNFIFSFLSLYLMISIFSYNGNVLGNVGGILAGVSYPYIFKSDTFHGNGRKLKIIFSIFITLLLSGSLASLIVFKC
ncbi:rhomboid protease ROM10 [Plasmodium gaboni]|uniref:Rhomboid protease ROM10 n=1 Tax=Plasmodium gaboni TaxID=647221 RepID=A0A151LRQ2_9APIC|nr:rhomboid protease ROM10 [Plasmodium gaboni]KYO01878.1 rhomboid protease ROM10 [Plasmodium gaboni]